MNKRPTTTSTCLLLGPEAVVSVPPEFQLILELRYIHDTQPKQHFRRLCSPMHCLLFSDRGAYHGFISFDIIGWDMRASISSCQLRSNWRSGWNVCSLTNSMLSLVVFKLLIRVYVWTFGFQMCHSWLCSQKDFGVWSVFWW